MLAYDSVVDLCFQENRVHSEYTSYPCSFGSWRLNPLS